MTEAVIVLSVISLIFIVLFIAQRRQIRKICRQLAFIRNEKSNMRITSDTPLGEINRLIEELNSLVKKYREIEKLSEIRERELKATITSLSHDIRTPLTSLDGYFQLLNQAEGDAEREKYSKVIQTRISALKDILEELFTYTKLQNTEYELPLEKVSLNKAVCDSLFLFYEELKSRGIEPQIKLPEKPVFINGNEEALHRTFHNIIKNSLEHCSPTDSTDTEINVSLEKTDGQAVFICANRIKDSDRIDVSQVFDRFYKSDSARTQTSTGLGLSIAKELTLRMGGEISANLDDDTFTVKIVYPTVL